MRHLRRIVTLGLLLGIAACEQDELLRPASNVPVDPLFTRYVALGNSITAGVQSSGINDSLQVLAYPVVLARAMQSPFFPPLMNRPGCSPPHTNVFFDVRVGGGTATTCALRRADPAPAPYISNTAVPNAQVIDAINNLAPGSSPNGLTTFFLGGLTQVQMAVRAQPTFVTVWLGNNELLGGALASDTTRIPDSTTFHANYRAMLDTLVSTGAEGLLIGVGLGTLSQTFLPHWSKGSTYYGLFLAGAFLPAPFTVTANCAPPRGDSVYVPFPFGLGLIRTAQGGTPTTLDCTEPQTIQPAEFAAFVRGQARNNAVIRAEAQRVGWSYTDVNAAFDSVRGVPGQINPFPVAPATNVANLCNTPPPTGNVPPFGAAFSCDGIHPSSAAQRLIARKVREVINAAYGTSIPAIP